jgi:hypothetical protein
MNKLPAQNFTWKSGSSTAPKISLVHERDLLKEQAIKMLCSLKVTTQEFGKINYEQAKLLLLDMLPLHCLVQVFVQRRRNRETKSTNRQAINTGQELPEAVDL